MAVPAPASSQGITNGKGAGDSRAKAAEVNRKAVNAQKQKRQETGTSALDDIVLIFIFCVFCFSGFSVLLAGAIGVIRGWLFLSVSGLHGWKHGGELNWSLATGSNAEPRRAWINGARKSDIRTCHPLSPSPMGCSSHNHMPN
ncbi:MAG: hypothetical protein WD042_17045 [Phycisphaeraceae bacterium]